MNTIPHFVIVDGETVETHSSRDDAIDAGMQYVGNGANSVVVAADGYIVAELL
jgi:hypothetical protein